MLRFFSSFWLWHCGLAWTFYELLHISRLKLTLSAPSNSSASFVSNPKKRSMKFNAKEILGAVHVSLDVGGEGCRILGPKNISFSKKKFRSSIWSNFSFESFTEDEAISVQIALKIQSSKKAHILLLISSWLISYLDQIKERLSSLSTNF